MITKKMIVSALCGTLFAGAAYARDQIQIVGSSTVFPFATTVAEQFGRTSSFKTPVIESTGSGGGMKLFCAGIGLNHPDITNASRRIKSSEFEKCKANGIDMTEVVIGFDGIVLANSKESQPLKLTLREIYLATAAKVPDPNKPCQSDWCEPIANPYKKWSDINPALPNKKIEILGPPPHPEREMRFRSLLLKAAQKHLPTLKISKKQIVSFTKS